MTKKTQYAPFFQVILNFREYNAGSEAEIRFRIDFNPHFPISISLFPNVLIFHTHRTAEAVQFFCLDFLAPAWYNDNITLKE